MSNESKFNKWFVEQFGKRPSKKPHHELIEEVRSCLWKLDLAKEELRKVESWEEANRAALYAWTAAKGDK